MKPVCGSVVFIPELDSPSYVARIEKIAQDHAYEQGFDDTECRLLAAELYRGLLCKALVLASKHDMDLSLPPRLDWLWHHVILETRFYKELCEKALGVDFLHHTAITMNDSIEQKNERVENTIRCYNTIYFSQGTLPNEWAWRREEEIPLEQSYNKIVSKSKKRERTPDFRNNDSQWNDRVQVKSLNGKEMSFRVNIEWMCVAAINLALNNQEGIPCDHQRLIFAGRHLEDAMKKPMSEYGLRDCVTLHLVLRLRGC